MKAYHNNLKTNDTALNSIIDDYEAVLQLPDIFHSIRVATLAEEMAYKIHLNKQKTKELYISAILHDIGKSMIKKEILNKAAQLTEREWNQIKHHAELGGIITTSMGMEGEVVKNIVCHHENYDGSGYPRKLKGNKIPLGAQIIRLCDTYDALRMERTYKKAYNHIEALQEIKKEKEKYNPYLLNIFMDLNFSNIRKLKKAPT